MIEIVTSFFFCVHLAIQKLPTDMLNHMHASFKLKLCLLAIFSQLFLLHLAMAMTIAITICSCCLFQNLCFISFGILYVNFYDFSHLRMNLILTFKTSSTHVSITCQPTKNIQIICAFYVRLCRIQQNHRTLAHAILVFAWSKKFFQFENVNNASCWWSVELDVNVIRSMPFLFNQIIMNIEHFFF